MAEFPDFGSHCSVPECRQLDLLPVKCDACSLILCKNHISYESHRCTESYKKNVQIPICPLCQQPVSLKRGEAPDIRVNQHIEQDCQSDLAKRKRSAPKCGIKGCLKRELLPMECKQCGVHFCLSHRHPSDHECKGTKAARNNRNIVDNDAALARALQDSLNIQIPQKPMNPEQLSFLLAQQLQQEEYERVNGNNFEEQSQRNDGTRANGSNNNNSNCTIS